MDRADRIPVMERRRRAERRHRAHLARLPGVGASGRRVTRLDVPDRLARDDPALAASLRARRAGHLA